jgi:hypothetical protein
MQRAGRYARKGKAAVLASINGCGNTHEPWLHKGLTYRLLLLMVIAPRRA